MKKPMTRFVATIFATLWLAGPLASVALSQPKPTASATKVRLAIPSPSLNYLPIYVAVQRGFFARRGFEIEMIQMTPALSTAALLSLGWHITLTEDLFLWILQKRASPMIRFL